MGADRLFLRLDRGQPANAQKRGVVLKLFDSQVPVGLRDFVEVDAAHGNPKASNSCSAATGAMRATAGICPWAEAALVPPPTAWARWMLERVPADNHFACGGGHSFQRLSGSPLVGLVFQHEPFAAYVGIWGRGEAVLVRNEFVRATDEGTLMPLSDVRDPLFVWEREWIGSSRYPGKRLAGDPPGLRRYLRRRVAAETLAILDLDWRLAEAASVARMVTLVGRPAWQLFLSNPRLALMLGTPQELEGPDTVPAEWWPDLFGLPQHECLEMLGFPARKSLPRLIRRVPWSLHEWADFRLILRHDPGWLHVIEPLPPLSALALNVMMVFRREDFETSFLRKFLLGISRPDPLRFRALLAEVALAGPDGWRDELRGPVRSLDELRGILAKIQIATMADSFPPPPVPGDVVFVPLATPADLHKVSCAMRHCAARMYGPEVCAGLAYFFQYGNRKSGLTLRLRYQHGGWALVEVRGQDNRLPTPEEWSAVVSWARARGLRIAVPEIKYDLLV